MSDYVIQCRHGQSFSFDPAKTALLVIDMQKDFLLEYDGTPNSMAAIIPNVVQLTNLCRDLGCTIVHTREAYLSDLSNVSPHKAEMNYVGRPGPRGRYLVDGEPGCGFVDELAPLPGERVLDKPGFGGFSTTDMHAVLQSEDITHLLLSGVTMQCCVHSTLREAVDHGYWCLTLADCCGAIRPEWHEATLSIIASENNLFGGICDLADFSEMQNAVTSPPAAQDGP